MSDQLDLFTAADPPEPGPTVASAPERPPAQLRELPGTTFEDIFPRPNDDCSNASGAAA